MEQGSHKELLQQDGIFAAMWADQISTSGDPTASIGEMSFKREEDLMESGGDAPPTDTTAPAAPAERAVSGVFVGNPDAIQDAVEQPADDAPDVPAKESTEDPAAAEATPAFPASDDTASREQVQRTASGVTFDPSANPSRTGTPDPESEPKRKRISSQNFQRFARKLTLTTRRQSSTASNPNLRREASFPGSTGEGSVRTANDSPSASVIGVDKAKGKKDKKDKKASS